MLGGLAGSRAGFKLSPVEAAALASELVRAADLQGRAPFPSTALPSRLAVRVGLISRASGFAW